jgi:hypothetical protein
MLATLGWVATDVGFHLPGAIKGSTRTTYYNSLDHLPGEQFEYSSVAAHNPAVIDFLVRSCNYISRSFFRFKPAS